MGVQVRIFAFDAALHDNMAILIKIGHVVSFDIFFSTTKRSTSRSPYNNSSGPVMYHRPISVEVFAARRPLGRMCRGRRLMNGIVRL